MRNSLKHVVLLNSGDAAAMVMTTNKSGTFNPTITKTGTVARWDMGDGSAIIESNSPSHSYADGSTKTVRVYVDDPSTVTQVNIANLSILSAPSIAQIAGAFPNLQVLFANSNASLAITGDLSDLPTSMAQLYLYSTSSTITGALSDLPTSMTVLHLGNTPIAITGALSDLPTSMTHLYLFSTPSAITGDLSDLPTSMTQLYLHNTPSTITGALSDLPTSMTVLHLGNTPIAVTGALSDLPTSMTHLYLYNTSSAVTGGGSAMAATGISVIHLQSLGFAEAVVDGIVDRAYADRALFTAGTPSLTLDGNNAAPSGTYQASATPSTGLEKVYTLENDNNAEGFNTWAISY